MERDPVTAVVAENIRAAMADRNLSAAELARMAMINPTGIYDILSGKSRSPKIETVHKIAKALCIPTSMMLERRMSLTLRNELLEVASQLPETEQRRLVSAARAWLNEVAPPKPTEID